jgi:hypothetical protein
MRIPYDQVNRLPDQVRQQVLENAVMLPTGNGQIAFEVDVDKIEPGLLTRLKGLAAAAAEFLADNLRVVTVGQLEERQLLCNGCEAGPNRKRQPLEMGYCKLCGCTGIKLGLASSRCPVGNWEAVN